MTRYILTLIPSEFDRDKRIAVLGKWQDRIFNCSSVKDVAIMTPLDQIVGENSLCIFKVKRNWLYDDGWENLNAVDGPVGAALIMTKKQLDFYLNTHQKIDIKEF